MIYCTDCPSCCSIWPLVLDVHQAEGVPHVSEEVRAGSAASAESASRVGSVPLSLSAVPKHAKEWLSPSARWLLNYAGELVMYWMPRHTRPFWKNGRRSSPWKQPWLPWLFCTALPSLKLSAAFRSLSSTWTAFVIQGSMLGGKTWCMLMTVRELQLTQIHSNSHTHTQRLREHWAAASLPCWMGQRTLCHKMLLSPWHVLVGPSASSLLGRLLKSLKEHRKWVVHLGCCQVTSILSEIQHFIIEAQGEHWTLLKKRQFCDRREVEVALNTRQEKQTSVFQNEHNPTAQWDYDMFSWIHVFGKSAVLFFTSYFPLLKELGGGASVGGKSWLAGLFWRFSGTSLTKMGWMLRNHNARVPFI